MRPARPAGRPLDRGAVAAGLARRYLALRIDEPAPHDTAGRVLAHAVLSLPLDLVSLALTVYLWSLVPANLAHPLRPGAMDSYQLRRVLGVLRAERSTEEGAEAAPQPTLDRLGDPLAGVRSAGLTVETSSAGAPRPLPPGVEVSAYRILQEALSNTMRHAPGSHVRVEIAYALAALRLCVVNGPHRAAAPTLPGPDHGLLGMRERAAMLGGEVTAGPASGGWLCGDRRPAVAAR